MRERSACGLAPRIHPVLVATIIPRLNWHAVDPGDDNRRVSLSPIPLESPRSGKLKLTTIEGVDRSPPLVTNVRLDLLGRPVGLIIAAVSSSDEKVGCDEPSGSHHPLISEP